MSRTIQRRNMRALNAEAEIPRSWSTSRALAVAALVFVGCALGARIGTILTYPEGPAILFPPYAVLTAALLLAPFRRWWLLILAAALGNFWPHLHFESSITFVLLAEGSNILRSLVAAVGIRLLTGATGSFSSLREMSVFLVFAALLGPAIGAFVGAIDVTLHNSNAVYWDVWPAWFLSNTVTALTLLPMLMIAFKGGTEWSQFRSSWRLLEAVLLTIGLLVVGYLALAEPHGRTGFPAILYAPLPLMIWAGVRFGPGGSIASMSVIAALSISGVLSGNGPFASDPPGDGLIQLQLALFAIAVPLFLLSAAIRQQRETHRALVRSQVQYRSVVEDQTELICRFLPDGTYTFVNEAYCRYFKRSQEELIGKNFFQFIPAESHEHCKAHLLSITRERPAATVEHEVVVPGEKIAWQQWTDHAFFDADGRVVDFQAVGRDITAQKMAEFALRDSEELHRVTLSNISDAVFLTDDNGQFTYVCSNVDVIFGYTPEDVRAIGRIHDLLGGSLPELNGAAEICNVEHEVTAKSGERRTVLMHIKRVSIRGGTILYVCRDITDRLRAEKALRENEERLAVAINAAELGVWDWDLVTGATNWSNQMRRLYGRDGVSAERPLESFLEMVHAEDRERVRTAIVESIECPAPYEAEYRVVLPDGTVRWIQAKGQTFFDAHGKPIRRSGANRDITSSKRAEQAVRESEDQLRMFVQHTPAAVAMFDRDMKYIVYSQRWLSDYKLGDQDLVGRSHYEIFPEIPERWKQVHQRCLAGAIESEEEDPFHRANGTIDWIRWDVRPWRRADGDIGGLIMFTELVTARKHADEARRRFEQRFRFLADQVPVHIWVEDENGRGVFANLRYLEYTGMTSDALLGSWPDIVHPDDFQSHFEKYRAAVSQLGKLHSQVRLRRRDGEYHWFDVIGMPLFEGDRFVGYVGCSIDITERKRAEAEHRLLETQRQREAVRRQSEERFRMLADNAPVLIWMAGLNNEAVYFNKPWLDFTGRALEQELDFGWAESVHPDDRQRCVETCEATFARREQLSMQFRLRRHDGEYRWVQDTGIPHFNPDGEFSGYIGSCVDITAHKLAEEELEQAARRKDEFLAILSHELRNPLAPISMALEVISRQKPTVSSLTWALDLIGRQAAQLTRLVDDLLDVSRITRGKIRLSVQNIDLAHVVRQAVETSRPLIDSRGHTLSIIGIDAPLPLRGDAVRLAQVVSNLLNNAAKYTDIGGQITLSVERDDDHVVLTVADNGVGIPTNMLGRVFEMFAQIDSASDRSQGGLGIGLTLVKRLVEEHRGTIEAHSDGPNQGSTFTVRLPLALDALDTAMSDSDDESTLPSQIEPKSKPRRILIVDDNVDAAESLSQMLQLQRHEVEVAHDGISALAAAERMNPEVVLLDIALPKLDGLEVARRLRRQHESQPILVATTGFGLADDRQRTAEAGFDYHMVKPLNPQALQDLLRHGK